MAMSNWDTLAIDLDGKSNDGCLNAPCGFGVEIYKNWLYLRHPQMWHAGCSFVAPTIIEMSHGEIKICNTTIIAKRGDTKQSVMVAAFHTAYAEQVKGETYKPPTYTGMVGIGCYGYKGDEWVGVERAEVDELASWLEALRADHDLPMAPPDVYAASRFNQGDAYFAERTGVGALLQATAPGEAHPTIMSQLLGEPTP